MFAVALSLFACTPDTPYDIQSNVLTPGTPMGDPFVAEHPEMGMVATFGDRGASIVGSTFDIDIEPVRYGRIDLYEDLELLDPEQRDFRVEYEQAGVVSWFSSDEAGIEHGFDLLEAPPGEGELRIEVALHGEEFWTTGPDSIVGRTDGEWVHYTGLVAEDATGTDLETWMTLDCRSGDCLVMLHVEDADAVYPVHIDPTLWVETVSNLSALVLTDLGPGDLIITEVMANPNQSPDSSGEWFEVFNTTGAVVNIEGLVFEDLNTGANFNTFTVADLTPDVEIGIGDYFVFGVNNSPANNGGLTVDYQYDNSNPLPKFQLGNSGDEIIMGYDPGTPVEINRIDYFASSEPNGATITVRPDSFADNNNSANWCDGLTVYGDGDFGTPGAANDDCDFAIDISYTWVFSAGGTVTDCVTTTFDQTLGLFATSDDGEGTFDRDTDAGGQDLDLDFEFENGDNGPSYTGTRPHGSDLWPTGSMSAQGLGVQTGASSWVELTVCP